ncbi:MAG: transporter [Prevotella sp.]|uniref:transporter n=1 Tax=Prevotella sp. TaxID=59823 RepID=UPI0025D2F33C|nr:transporter [Prevotella sp.]MCI7118938.1 transporter [Prevotella sp.]
MQILRFIKDWTLPVAIATGITVYLVFALVPALDGFATAADPIFQQLLPVFMFLVLFVTFCKVDYRKLRPVAWHWWIGLFQVLTVGAIMALILCLHLTGDSLILAEAVLTCIICPCASATAVVTQKLGGNLEEMTTYTFLSNFITALLIPVCFPMIDKAADIHFLEAFALILYKVFTVLVVPMILAYIVKHHAKDVCQRITSIKDLSYYLWGCSLLIVSGTTMKNILHANTSIAFLLVIAVCSLVLCLFQFGCGRAIGSRFNQTVNAGQALGQKNTAFAIWIASTYLSPLSSVGPGCYILWQNIINSWEIWEAQKRRI